MPTIQELAQLSLAKDLDKETVYNLLLLFRTNHYLTLDSLNPELHYTALSLSKKGILKQEGNLISRDSQKLLDFFIQL